MKAETAKAICDALDDQGAEYARHADYSGRSMYGKTTVGIVVGDFGTFIGAVARAAANMGPDGSTGADEFVEDVSKVRWDNMGRSDIIVY